MQVYRHKWQGYIHFSDGTKMKEVETAFHLGGTLTQNAGRTEEIQSRMCKAQHTCSKLKLLRRKTNCKYKWKLQTYNAIIVAQLTYGYNLQINFLLKRRNVDIGNIQ